MQPWMFRHFQYNPVGPLTPDLSKVKYRTASSPILFANNPPRPTFVGKLMSKARHVATSRLNRCSNQESRLLNLPPETVLMIASHLPDASRASLAITCKALLSICSDTALFVSIQLPTEQPSNFRSTRMSKPQNYQPSRWEFLCHLEHDLSGKWQLCSECFTLHPRRMFAEFEKFSVPWLHHYYTAKAPEYRSCRHERRHLGSEHNACFAPVGVIDLCPCIKLTLRKKRHLEAHLRQNARTSPGNDRPVAADFWWHQCQHSYSDGAIKLEIKIGIFLYDGTERERWLNYRSLSTKTNIFSRPPQVGQLGVLIDYRHTYPSMSTSTSLERSPRVLCPHLNLDTAIQDLLHCRKRHYLPDAVCTWCKDIQYCEYCRTKVLDLCEVENADGADGTTTCCYQVERCLDDQFFTIQTVFPFMRRQIPLQRRSPLLVS